MEHVFNYEKNKITLSGVVGVESFEEKEARIKLTDNVVTLKGNNFVMQEMTVSGGKLVFSGNISSVVYQTKFEKTSFLNKLFK